jgi:superoxide dismutase
MMQAKIRPLPAGATSLNGLSEKLLRSHHENNYAGAVKRLNAIRDQLAGIPFAEISGFGLNGLKREELIATNSMVLLELYFDGLGGDGKTMEPAMDLAFSANFGSFARWREEFVAMGKALGGGSGWVLLTFNPREGTLVNQWASDHTQTVAGGVPLLALDMYEHSYHMDYGAAAGAYVDGFMQNIDFAKVIGATKSRYTTQRRRWRQRTTTWPTLKWSTCAVRPYSRMRPRRYPEPSGATLHTSPNGRQNCRSIAKSSFIACTATKSGVPLRCAFGRPVSTRTFCAAASMAGTRSGHEVDHT